MANRWGAPIGPTPPQSEDVEEEPRGEGPIPAHAVESWRTWLLTGKSGVVSDRRRVRGSHRGRKQMLVDGTGQEMPPSWRHFSGAMVRLAINDALNSLPAEQTHVVWLGHFGRPSSSLPMSIGTRMNLSGISPRRRNSMTGN